MHTDELLRLLLDRRGSILGHIGTILADRDAGEDVFQETMILANESAARFANPAHAMAWVRTTARNLALNEARKAHRRAVVLDERALDLLDRAWAARDHLADRDELARLQDCVQRLAPSARAMVRLRFVEGLGGEQIALRMGRTVSAVQSALSRIYRSLAGCMQGAPA